MITENKKDIEIYKDWTSKINCLGLENYKKGEDFLELSIGKVEAGKIWPIWSKKDRKVDWDTAEIYALDCFNIK